eukprot:487171_1
MAEKSTYTVIDISSLESDPKSYWGMRIRKFVEDDPELGLQNVKDTLKDDAAAWSVFAALLMTVGFAALTISSDDYNSGETYDEFLSYLYVFFNASAAFISFMAVVLGTNKYAYYNNMPASLIDRAVTRSKHWFVVPFVYIATIFQCFGAVVGVFLLFGLGPGIVTTIIALLAVVMLG